MTTRMCDLSPDLAREIFARVPITSLKAVRSTCKLWNDLCKHWILSKAAAARKQFLGFMTVNSKEDYSRLLVWNPYLGQTKWIEIEPRRNYDCGFGRYALGYDMNRNHKIFKFCERDSVFVEYEIYDFSSSSWRVLSVTRDWRIKRHQCIVSLKGNTYFVVDEKTLDSENCLLCFDFERERFGDHLSLPFHSYSFETVALSCVKEEQLAALYLEKNSVYEMVKI